MASNEAGLWEWLRDFVLPLGHYSRIESPDTAPGFPDVDYAIPEENPLLEDYVHTGKIELKHSRRVDVGIPFRNDRDGLHKSQQIWIRDHVRANGVVWIFAEVGNEVFCIPGKHAGSFNGCPVHEMREELALAILPVNDIREAAEIAEKILTTPLYILEKHHG